MITQCGRCCKTTDVAGTSGDEPALARRSRPTIRLSSHARSERGVRLVIHFELSTPSPRSREYNPFN